MKVLACAALLLFGSAFVAAPSRASSDSYGVTQSLKLQGDNLSELRVVASPLGALAPHFEWYNMRFVSPSLQIEGNHLSIGREDGSAVSLASLDKQGHFVALEDGVLVEVVMDFLQNRALALHFHVTASTLAPATLDAVFPATTRL